MAELEEEARDRVLGIFLREYNALHGTAFKFNEAEPDEDASCDYLCVDIGGEKLKVQHTRALLKDDNPIGDRAFLAAVERQVIRAIWAWVRQKDLRGYSIGVDVKNLPRDRKKVGSAVWWLLQLIEHAIKEHEPADQSSMPVLRIDRDVLTYWRPIQDFLELVDVRKFSDNDNVHVWWGATRGDNRTQPLTRAADAASWALEKKQAALGGGAGDLVLLIHYDLMPYDPDWELPWITNQLGEMASSFREVWVVSDTQWPPATAHRVIPAMPSSFPASTDRIATSL